MLEGMKHRRCCIERLLDGWLHATSADDEERWNEVQQLGRTIVPFAQLPKQDEPKDRGTVWNIPDILAVADGLVLVRR